MRFSPKFLEILIFGDQIFAKIGPKYYNIFPLQIHRNGFFYFVKFETVFVLFHFETTLQSHMCIKTVNKNNMFLFVYVQTKQFIFVCLRKFGICLGITVIFCFKVYEKYQVLYINQKVIKIRFYWYQVCLSFYIAKVLICSWKRVLKKPNKIQTGWNF